MTTASFRRRLYQVPYFYGVINDKLVSRPYVVMCTLFMFIGFFLLEIYLGPRVSVPLQIEPLIFALLTALAMVPLWFSATDHSNRIPPLVTFLPLSLMLSALAYLSVKYLSTTNPSSDGFFTDLTVIQGIIYSVIITPLLLYIFYIQLYAKHESKYHVHRLRCYQKLVKRLLTKDEEGLKRQFEAKEEQFYVEGRDEDDYQAEDESTMTLLEGSQPQKKRTKPRTSIGQKIIQMVKAKFGSPFNPHAKYETADDFFYPSRFLSVLIVFVATLTVNYIYLCTRRDSAVELLTDASLIPDVFTADEMTAVFYTIPTVVYVFNMCQAYLLSKSYRAEIFRMRQGKCSYDTKKFIISTSSNGLLGLMFINAPFALLYGILLGGGIYAGIKALILFEFLRKFAKNALIKFLSSSLIVIVVRLIINIMVNRIFFRPSGWIRFMRLYSTVEYFDTFYGVFTVSVKILKTIILYLLSPMLLISRPDTSLLPRPFETMDDAHKSYVSNILLDHHHNNPIILVFVDMLYHGTPVGRSSQHYSASDVNLLTYRKTKWGKYWRLLITLSRNPQLIGMRRTAPGKTYSEHERVSINLPPQEPTVANYFPVRYE